MANNDGWSNTLRADSLNQGDQLVQIRTDTWSQRIIDETKFTVRKVTKTRVVLDSHFGREYRVLIRDGEVSNRFEGDKRTHVRLYTADDPELAKRRRAHEREVLKGNARSAAEAYTRDYSNIDKAKAARDALDTWITARETRESQEED